MTMETHDVTQYLDWVKERYSYLCSDENLLCRKCTDSIPVCFTSKRFPRWCLSFACSKQGCGRKWHTCYRCVDSARIRRSEDLLRHDELHQPQKNGGAAELHDSVTETSGNNQQMTEDPLQSYFPQSEWADFFTHHRDGNALRFLVAKQFSDSQNPSHITQEDVELHVLIAALCNNLTKGQKLQFAEILSRVYKKDSARDCQVKIDDKLDTSQLVLNCGIPTTCNELLGYVQGKRSILSNIPQPTIYSASNGDAYVRLPDVIKLYLSFGIKPSTVRTINETGPVGSDAVTEDVWNSCQAKKRLQRLLHKSGNTMKAGLVQWSDGCDANVGCKSNRGSI